MPTEAAPYFSVEPSTGDIRVDPLLADYTEGIFTFDMVATQQRTASESIEIVHIIKQVYLFWKGCVKTGFQKKVPDEAFRQGFDLF